MPQAIRLIQAGQRGAGTSCRCPDFLDSLCVRMPVVRDPGEGRLMALALLADDEVEAFEQGFMDGTVEVRTTAPEDCPLLLTINLHAQHVGSPECALSH